MVFNPTFEDLPTELKLSVLNYLPRADLLALRLVSRSLKVVAEDEGLWRKWQDCRHRLLGRANPLNESWLSLGYRTLLSSITENCAAQKPRLREVARLSLGDGLGYRKQRATVRYRHQGEHYRAELTPPFQLFVHGASGERRAYEDRSFEWDHPTALAPKLMAYGEGSTLRLVGKMGPALAVWDGEANLLWVDVCDEEILDIAVGHCMRGLAQALYVFGKSGNVLNRQTVLQLPPCGCARQPLLMALTVANEKASLRVKGLNSGNDLATLYNCNHYHRLWCVTEGTQDHWILAGAMQGFIVFNEIIAGTGGLWHLRRRTVRRDLNSVYGLEMVPNTLWELMHRASPPLSKVYSAFLTVTLQPRFPLLASVVIKGKSELWTAWFKDGTLRVRRHQMRSAQTREHHEGIQLPLAMELTALCWVETLQNPVLLGAAGQDILLWTDPLVSPERFQQIAKRRSLGSLRSFEQRGVVELEWETDRGVDILTLQPAGKKRKRTASCSEGGDEVDESVGNDHHLQNISG
jgi:hypothetical protein